MIPQNCHNALMHKAKQLLVIKVQQSNIDYGFELIHFKDPLKAIIKYGST